jgi:hypothetical protein
VRRKDGLEATEHLGTLYEHAGGEQPLHRLEEPFYDKVLANRVLKVQFRERIPTHVDHLTWFTAESFGGPTASPGSWVAAGGHFRSHNRAGGGLAAKWCARTALWNTARLRRWVVAAAGFPARVRAQASRASLMVATGCRVSWAGAHPVRMRPGYGCSEDRHRCARARRRP